MALAGGVLAAAALLAAFRVGSNAAPGSDRDIVISVPDVPGPYCVYGIEKRLRELNGVERVELAWDEDEIRVILAEGSALTDGDVRSAVERAEYPYEYRVEW